MKKKLLVFILIVIFVISFPCCSVEAVDLYHSHPVCCECVDSEEEQEEDHNLGDELMIPYTAEEIQQIRQNLVGRYDGIDQEGRTIGFCLSLDNIPGYTSVIRQEDFILDLSFLRERFPGRANEDDYNYYYGVEFDSENPTQITRLRALFEDYCVVEYFDKSHDDVSSDSSDSGEYDHLDHGGEL